MRRAGATEAEARAMAERIVRSKSGGAIGGRTKPAPLAIPVRALARRRGKEAPPFRPEEARRGADSPPPWPATLPRKPAGHGGPEGGAGSPDGSGEPEIQTSGSRRESLPPREPDAGAALR